MFRLDQSVAVEHFKHGRDAQADRHHEVIAIRTDAAMHQPSLGRRLGVLVVASIAIWSTSSRAQTIGVYFPQGINGYDQQLGVTVLTRARTEYDPLGIQLGDFLVHSRLDESLFYNSSVNATDGSGSWGSHTAASAFAGSGWTRDSLSAAVGFDHYQFFSLPNESYTDWNIGLSGGYTVGDNQILVAYSHQSYHQLGTNIGAVRSETPILDQTDTARVQYTFNFSRLAITPDLSVSAYRFGPATVLGETFSQGYLDYNVVAGGVTARYSLSEEGGLLVVARGLSSSYTTPQPGQLSNDSNSLLLLAGIDYQAKGPWRYRLLAGVEVRQFAASQYGTHTAPDIEGSVIWSPTSLTTVTGTVANAIEAPQTAGTSGYTLTQARLAVDHEYLRNVLLQARGAAQYAQYLQGGATQTHLTGGAGVTWLINRGIRLSLDYDYTTQSGSGSAANQNVAAQTTLQYNQNLLALTLHVAL